VESVTPVSGGEWFGDVDGAFCVSVTALLNSVTWQRVRVGTTAPQTSSTSCCCAI
jgi:hypothetical protein